MLLVASAAASPSRRMDLSTTGRLSFSVTAREKDAAAAQQVLPETDLLPLVSEPKEAAGALSNGHQSIIIAAVYTVRLPNSQLAVSLLVPWGGRWCMQPPNAHAA